MEFDTTGAVRRNSERIVTDKFLMTRLIVVAANKKAIEMSELKKYSIREKTVVLALAFVLLCSVESDDGKAITRFGAAIILSSSLFPPLC